MQSMTRSIIYDTVISKFQSNSQVALRCLASVLLTDNKAVVYLLASALHDYLLNLKQTPL